jgi:hypothetical protein
MLPSRTELTPDKSRYLSVRWHTTTARHGHHITQVQVATLRYASDATHFRSMKPSSGGKLPDTRVCDRFNILRDPIRYRSKSNHNRSENADTLLRSSLYSTTLHPARIFDATYFRDVGSIESGPEIRVLFKKSTLRNSPPPTTTHHPPPQPTSTTITIASQPPLAPAPPLHHMLSFSVVRDRPHSG